MADCVGIFSRCLRLSVNDIKGFIVPPQHPGICLPRLFFVAAKGTFRDPDHLARVPPPLRLGQDVAFLIRIADDVSVLGFGRLDPLIFLVPCVCLLINNNEHSLVHGQMEQILPGVPFPVSGKLLHIRSNDGVTERFPLIGSQKVPPGIRIAHGVWVYRIFRGIGITVPITVLRLRGIVARTGTLFPGSLSAAIFFVPAAQGMASSSGGWASTASPGAASASSWRPCPGSGCPACGRGFRLVAASGYIHSYPVLGPLPIAVYGKPIRCCAIGCHFPVRTKVVTVSIHPRPCIFQGRAEEPVMLIGQEIPDPLDQLPAGIHYTGLA